MPPISDVNNLIGVGDVVVLVVWHSNKISKQTSISFSSD